MVRRIIGGLLLALAFPRLAAAQSCGGVERWAVKVGSDTAASSINITNRVPTTLHDLVPLFRPTLPTDDGTRLSQERTVRMVDARLVKFKMEAGKTGDADFHLVISDDTLQFSTTDVSPHSFVAEIVNPDCVGGRHDQVQTPSQFQNQLVDVHAKFTNQFPNMDTDGSWNAAGGIPVRLTGIGFFDRPHGQTGRALNGLELHPLLDIDFSPGTMTVAPTPAGLLQNPGFESGNQGWTTSPDVISDDQNQPPHSGNAKAWLGGYGETHTDRLSQGVTLPATASGISLTFFLHVSTEEHTTTQSFDTLRVQVRRANGQVTTLKTSSNLQAQPGFSLQTVDLTSFRSQTVRIQLVATEDEGSMTSFIVDDVAIVIESWRLCVLRSDRHLIRAVRRMYRGAGVFVQQSCPRSNPATNRWETVMNIRSFAPVIFAGVVGSAACAPSSEPPAQVPVELDITQSAPEFEVGSDVAFTVTLKNDLGQPITARSDTPVILTSPALGSLNAVIPEGSQSAVVHWRADKPGIFQVRATAHDMAPKAVLVPVKAASPRPQNESSDVKPPPQAIDEARPTMKTIIPPAPGAAGRGATVSVDEHTTKRSRSTISRNPATSAIAPGAATATSARVRPTSETAVSSTASSSIAAINAPAPDGPVLKLYVEPEPVDAVNRVWSADISFMLESATGVLRTAPEDVQIDVTSRFARVSPRQVIVPAGKATSRATPVHLVADRPGEDQIEGVSTIGRASQLVHFRPAAPTAVAVAVSPMQVISDGRTAATVSVRLVDDTKRMRPAEDETEVVLVNSSGSLKATSLMIPKGGRTAATTIVSTT